MEARRACAALGRGKSPGQRAAEQRDLASQIPTPHPPSPRALFLSHPAFSEGVRGKVGFQHRYKAEGKNVQFLFQYEQAGPSAVDTIQARRATGSAGRIRLSRRAAFRQHVSESSALPQPQLKGARL